MRLFNFLKKGEEKEVPAKVAAVKEQKTEEAAKVQPSRAATSVVPGVLIHPLITEKGTHFEAQGTYQFAVAVRATKADIARAFSVRYGVRPRAVRVMHRMGKTVRFGRTFGRRSDWKRALITVPKGTTINVHEGV